MTKLKVNVIIAGRTYPLSVNTIQEEEGMRKAAKNINELIAKFEQNYAVNDKQDVLAMCALQFASKSEILSLKNDETNNETTKKINELTELVASHLY
ncbi:cell division protein ZapA [Tenacibaculum maritimum]|uniref:cell division protein ZapA n=1 Tax=Tenacibaculum maritimum TaxID=107401 RepID=UPI0010A426AC|nr:cell division protein ZapA [Tenacibaculum maritimum]MCD9562417.1 cell division protein ZapA [Tenacibaculum maritimum]MCD9564507.1 cell division protein ZapA [Tenacibaculum maritimum]MCD9578142.1 cell division protein ZapA [Tenacibaculum maritimum]MCD9595537.1 cell division protein ZapA [Tenacibaculum maritimum]MCD9612751.1 cell division protein ZapA [Tenacibaculum maritimum]